MSDPTPAIQQPAPEPVRPKAKEPGGFGRGFGMGLGLAVGAGLLAIVLTIISTIGFVMSIAALSSADTTDTALETVWGDDSADSTIVTIPVTGPILGDSGGDSTGGMFGTATYGYDVAAEIDDLEADDADALILEMDTPGGTIYGSKAIFDAVERYQKRTKKPAVAYVRGMSASGGMYAMAGADEIIVDHGTLVGSIGVIFGPVERYNDVRGTTGTLLTEGVETNGGITQENFTAGKGKDFGNPYRDMTPEERANIQTWVDSEYANFVNHVATNRQIAPERIRDEFGAYVFGPTQAVANGLADSEMGQEEAYRHVAELAKVDPDDTRVVTETSDSFASLFLGADARRAAPDGMTSTEAARRELAASAFCTSGASVLAIHGDPSAYCR